MTAVYIHAHIMAVTTNAADITVAGTVAEANDCCVLQKFNYSDRKCKKKKKNMYIKLLIDQKLIIKNMFG